MSINKINEYFVNIGRDIVHETGSGIVTTDMDLDNYRQVHSLVLLPTSEHEVDEIIHSLRTNSAVGWDEIPTKLIQKCSDVLVPVITHICNISMRTGIFPRLFKRAVVLPNI